MHGFSDLKTWRSLARLRIDPSKATALQRALLVLTRQAHHPLTDDHDLRPAACARS